MIIERLYTLSQFIELVDNDKWLKTRYFLQYRLIIK